MSSNLLDKMKTASLDLMLDGLEKKTGFKAVESCMKGVGYMHDKTGWAIVDLNRKAIITGDWDMLPVMLEELKGLYEQYSGMVT